MTIILICIYYDGMYICLCNAITDRAIRQAAADGVSDLDELKRRTGCASTCGSCADLAEEVLRDCVARHAPLRILAAA